MDANRARELQKSVATEVISLVNVFGNAADTRLHEQSIGLIGKAWKLPDEVTGEQLALIQREKEIMNTVGEDEKADHIRKGENLRHCWTGMETLDAYEDLFATSLRLGSYAERKALFDMASELTECQNLLDWIEKTPAEKELPEAVAV